MANTYRALSRYGLAIYGEDTFEGEFTASEEYDHLNGGHLEIVPRTYKALSRNFTGAKRGEKFAAAYPVEVEAALVSGGHIERVDSKSTEKKG